MNEADRKLRDEFAKAAMQTMLADLETWSIAGEIIGPTLARKAYDMAQYMMAERSKR